MFPRRFSRRPIWPDWAAQVFIHAFQIFLFFLAASGFGPSAQAQESPYIVTYDHYLEEPGSLEAEYFSTFGTQRGGNDFHFFWAEFNSRRVVLGVDQR